MSNNDIVEEYTRLNDGQTVIHHINDHFCDFYFISEKMYCILWACNFDSWPPRK